MATQTIIYCDRCGLTIPTGSQSEINDGNPAFDPSAKSYDLCEPCYKEFEQFIKTLSVQGFENAKEEEKD